MAQNSLSQITYDHFRGCFPDTEILQIEATDRDEKHKLSLHCPQQHRPTSMRKFRIDPNTGVLLHG